MNIKRQKLVSPPRSTPAFYKKPKSGAFQNEY
jgi:hypothetical protein